MQRPALAVHGGAVSQPHSHRGTLYAPVEFATWCWLPCTCAQVPGCPAELLGAKPYYSRYHICAEHAAM